MRPPLLLRIGPYSTGCGNANEPSGGKRVQFFPGLMWDPIADNVQGDNHLQGGRKKLKRNTKSNLDTLEGIQGIKRQNLFRSVIN